MPSINSENLLTILNKEPDEIWSQHVYRWPMVSSPYPTLTACAVFVLLVRFLGPSWMRDRKPFQIKWAIISYNFMMVLLNLWLFLEFGRLGWFGKYSFKCQPFDRTMRGMLMNRVTYIYFLSKFIDWMDTVFFVLTKKFSHITWLHLIHHSSMPINMYIGMRLAPNGHGTLACMLNSLVHVVMYSYYGLACCGDRVKPFLWWKKYITQMQLVQFVLIFVHMSNTMRSSCDYPPQPFYILSIAMVSFIILFINFYIQRYIRPSKLREKTNDKNNNDFKNESKAPFDVILQENLSKRIHESSLSKKHIKYNASG